MKKCQHCAEEIQDEATTCRYCGKPQTSKGCAFGALIGLAALAFLGVKACSSGPDAPEAANAVAVSKPEGDPRKCAEQMLALKKAGLVTEMPSLIRIDAPDLVWAAMDAKDKRNIINVAACMAFGGRYLHQLKDMEYITVYGTKSGKRIAMGSNLGVRFE